ncbi:MAG: hypothetical protein MUE71_09185 [Chitinophagaceae bacterium]|nr:hypothetical protein [Chitinophagaceae bacterium]
MLPLFLAGAFFSCERKQPEKAIPLESVVWYANKCTDAQNEEILCPYSFIRLQKNGQFMAAALRGYASGKWQKMASDEAVVLVLDMDSTTATDELAPAAFRITYHSAKYLNLVMARSESDIQTGNLTLLRMRPGKIQSEANPFTNTMQEWRAKPSRAESPEAIKARTIAYLQFLKNFYAFTALNKIENPDTDWFPNVMKMDNYGSVRLSYSNELKDWYKCFYNEGQAVEAYKIISGPFLNVKLKKMEDLNLRNKYPKGNPIKNPAANRQDFLYEKLIIQINSSGL